MSNRIAALKKLQEGNGRFVNGTTQHPNQSKKRVDELTSGQNPFAIVLSCADSRVPPELVFDQGLGDIFVIRVAGNVLDESVVASIEFAVGVLETPLLVVLGHTKCGAVEAALGNDELLGELPWLANVIREGIAEVQRDGDDVWETAVVANAKHVAQQLAATNPMIKPAAASGKLQIVPALYRLESGVVEWFAE